MAGGKGTRHCSWGSLLRGRQTRVIPRLCQPRRRVSGQAKSSSFRSFFPELTMTRGRSMDGAQQAKVLTSRMAGMGRE